MNKTPPELRVTPAEYKIIQSITAARFLTSGVTHKLDLDGLTISVDPIEWQVFQLNDLKVTLSKFSISDTTKANIDSLIQQIQKS